jgi:hypothetical protein
MMWICSIESAGAPGKQVFRQRRPRVGLRRLQLQAFSSRDEGVVVPDIFLIDFSDFPRRCPVRDAGQSEWSNDDFV